MEQGHSINDLDAITQRLRQYRHKAHREEFIRSVLASQTADNAAQLVRAALWHKDGAAATTGYMPSEYEDILRRDLLLTARCLGACVHIEPTLAREIADALTAICLNRSSWNEYKPLRQRVDAILPILASGKIGQEMQQQLLIALQEANWGVRLNAVEALGQLGNASQDTVKALLPHLQDTDLNVRCSAAAALGQTGNGSENVATSLINFLHDSPPDLWYSAVEALGRLGNTADEVLTVLLDVVQEYFPTAQNEAWEALWILTSDRAADGPAASG